METIELKTKEARVVIAPDLGGSMLAFEAFGQPVLRNAEGATDVRDSACFPMVPFCGRIRDGRFTFDGRELVLPPTPGFETPIHGSAWLETWDVHSRRTHPPEMQDVSADGSETVDLVEVESDGLWMERRFAADQWPWEFHSRFQMNLFRMGTQINLGATLSLMNISGFRMPYGFGLHPYFDLTSPARLTTEAETVWLPDDQLLPVGTAPATGDYALGPNRDMTRTVLDHNFLNWSREAQIDWPDRGLKAKLEASEAFAHVTVFRPEGGDFFCVEPCSNTADAFNIGRKAGMRVLDPGESVSGSMTISVARTP